MLPIPYAPISSNISWKQLHKYWTILSIKKLKIKKCVNKWWVANWQCNWEEKTEKTEKEESKSNKNRKQSPYLSTTCNGYGETAVWNSSLPYHSHVPRAPIPYLTLSFTRTIIFLEDSSRDLANTRVHLTWAPHDMDFHIYF